jgi:hypothetical protein
MRVQRVAIPWSGLESWTVLGDDDIPVGPAEGWLALPDQHRAVAEHGESVRP